MRSRHRSLLLALPLVACATNEPTQETMSNPLAIASTLPFQAPVFDKLQDSHYEPAIEAGMAKQLAEVEAIITHPEAPTFENTIVAMEKTGRDLTRASNIFFNLTGSATNDSLQAVKARLMPKLSAHNDAITLNTALFQRVKAVHDGRTGAGLDPVQQRLVERYYTRFVRAGALLNEAGKEQLKRLNEEEANLNT
ncbi:MAG: dipeptidyl carboxypeptidase II, partial [Flavobacteriales bacterium]